MPSRLCTQQRINFGIFEKISLCNYEEQDILDFKEQNSSATRTLRKQFPPAEFSLNNESTAIIVSAVRQVVPVIISAESTRTFVRLHAGSNGNRLT